MGGDLLIMPPRDVGGIAIIGDDVMAAVDRLLDKAIEDCPSAAFERDLLRQELLRTVSEIGYIPESVSLKLKAEPE